MSDGPADPLGETDLETAGASHPSDGRRGDRRAAENDLLDQLIAAHERELCALAGERVRRRVEPGAWAAFVETARNGRGAAEVARELGMPVGSVHQATYSVTKLLKREVEALEGPS